MSRSLGKELPADLYRRLEGNDLESCGEKAIAICTVDARGWPHPAMLSYFEVIARDRRNLRLAIGKDSTTTKNMRRNGKLTLLVIDERVAYYIKGHVQELKPAMDSAPHNSKLGMEVEEVLADEADQQSEAGAYVTSGITYKCPRSVADQLKARQILKELLE